jgi:TolB-like protein
VLAFTNMSGDPEQEYFADGVVEDIITALSRFKWLTVIARNSSFTYKGRAVDVKQVGRELGVRYVLEGSIRKAGTRLRIAGQLIEATSGRHIWAERYDRDLNDVFAVCGLFYPDWDKVTVALAEYYGAIFVDGGSCYDSRYRGFDGLHMNAYGHQVVATRLFPVIQKLLSAKEETATAQPDVRNPTPPVTAARSRAKGIERQMHGVAR